MRALGFWSALCYDCQLPQSAPPGLRVQGTGNSGFMYGTAVCVLQVNPESLLMLHGHAADEAGSGDAGLFLHAGLSNGVMTRTEVDRITGGNLLLS